MRTVELIFQSIAGQCTGDHVGIRGISSFEYGRICDRATRGTVRGRMGCCSESAPSFLQTAVLAVGVKVTLSSFRVAQDLIAHNCSVDEASRIRYQRRQPPWRVPS